MAEVGRKSSLKEENNVKRLLNPWSSSPRLWNKIFLVSCVIGISIDPLFLYIPIIDKGRKCLSIDENVKYVALILRTATDLFYVLHIIFRLQNALVMAKEHRLSVFTGFPWLYLFIDVLAILPMPQVILLMGASRLAGARSLLTRKILNSLLLLQYVPRAIRVYFSAKDLGRRFDSLTRRVWIKGAFFFFLYIIFGHITGALWYFYAIFRETACWHEACLGLSGCEPSHFYCGLPNPTKNITYVNEYCPVDPPNADVYDFGIFLEAVESGVTTKIDFMQKFSRCFWWGLRNLSSFGQNLETSVDIQEIIFAILILIVGILSFLYLIGNLQTYMQLAITKSEERTRRINNKQPELDHFLSSQSLPKHKKNVITRYLQRTIREDKDLDVKHLFSLVEEHSDHSHNKDEILATWVTKIVDFKKHESNNSAPNIDVWISKNKFPLDMDASITRYVRLRLPEVKNVDLGNILPILPFELGKSVKRELCFPMLQKVPILENMDKHVHETICNYLKPVVYEEKSYIVRKDEPLDFILLLTQGVVWSFRSSTTLTECLKKGDYFGKELLEWRLNSASYDGFPKSEANLKCHTKVEAFTLMAMDLDSVLFICWTKFCDPNKPMPEGLKPFAANTLRQKFQRNVREKMKSNKASLRIEIEAGANVE